MSCHEDYGTDKLTGGCVGGMPLDDEDDIDWEEAAAMEGADAASERTAAAPTTAADDIKEP